MRQEIYTKVLAAMQDAEEMGGPEGHEYLGLMQDIAAEATRRRETYLANIDPYRTLVEQISRMKTEEEFEGGDCPPSESSHRQGGREVVMQPDYQVRIQFDDGEEDVQSFFNFDEADAVYTDRLTSETRPCVMELLEVHTQHRIEGRAS